MDSQTLGAVATIALVLVTGIGLTFAALAPYRVAQRQRKDAEPAIVVEAQDFWKVTYGPVQELAVRPGGADGMAGALVLGEPSWPPPGKASNSGELSCARRILVRFTNVGATAAIGLRVPLRLSFSYLAKDAATAGNPETLGLRHETVTHSVAVTPEDAAIYRAIAAKGYKLTSKMMPSDRTTDFLETLQKNKL